MTKLFKYFTADYTKKKRILHFYKKEKQRERLPLFIISAGFQNRTNLVVVVLFFPWHHFHKADGLVDEVISIPTVLTQEKNILS